MKPDCIFLEFQCTPYDLILADAKLLWHQPHCLLNHQLYVVSSSSDVCAVSDSFCMFYDLSEKFDRLSSFAIAHFL
jgi:hypothetical protein